MLRIAVCDYDPISRNEISRFINEQEALIKTNYSKYEIIQYSKCEQLLYEFEEKAKYPTLMYIAMSPEKHFDGISISKEIRKFDENVIIIVIGESESYLSLGYEIFAFRYLIKPIDNEKFSLCLHDALNHIKRRERIVVYTHKREKIAVRASDIIAAERIGRFLEIRLTDKVHRAALAFGKFEKQLPLSEFLKADRGIIVNMRHISRIQGGIILLTNGSRYAISRERQKECFEKFCGYYSKTM